MKKARLYDETLVELSPIPSTVKQGGELFSALLARCPNLEAVFCSNDDLVLGELKCQRFSFA